MICCAAKGAGFRHAKPRLNQKPRKRTEANPHDWLFCWLFAPKEGAGNLSSEAKVQFGETTRAAIRAQLEAGYPNEAGGFLLGEGRVAQPRQYP